MLVLLLAAVQNERDKYAAVVPERSIEFNLPGFSMVELVKADQRSKQASYEVSQ